MARAQRGLVWHGRDLELAALASTRRSNQGQLRYRVWFSRWDADPNRQHGWTAGTPAPDHAIGGHIRRSHVLDYCRCYRRRPAQNTLRGAAPNLAMARSSSSHNVSTKWGRRMTVRPLKGV